MKKVSDVAKAVNEFITNDGGINLHDDTQQERLIEAISKPKLEPYQEEFKAVSLNYLYKTQAELESDLSEATDENLSNYLNMKLADINEAIRWLEEDYGKEGCFDELSKMQPED